MQTPTDNPFLGPDPKLGAACKTLLDDNQQITVRAVARHLGIAHTTISRDEARKAQLKACSTFQAAAQKIAQTHRGRIDVEESADLAKAKLRIEKLDREKALLLASHKAMLLAVGELGGIEGWKRFFPKYQEIEAELRAMGAMPEASITPLHREKIGD